MVPTKVLLLILFAAYSAGFSVVGYLRKLGHCEGRLELISRKNLKVVYTKTSTKMLFKPTKAILTGCQCFRLFERRNGKGRSFLLDTLGETSVPLRRVRSLYKVSCDRSKNKVARKLLRNQKKKQKIDENHDLTDLEEKNRRLLNDIQALEQVVIVYESEIELYNS